MDWETILTSGVIAAIVAAIIELVKMNNSNKATYIIKQREKWRDKIRTIAEEICKSDYKHICIPLTNLKTRINAYGKVESTPEKNDVNDIRAYYLKDGHIHKIIKDIENNEENKHAEVFETNKSKLIGYLEMLLKFDWERSKKESTINLLFICSLIIEFISVLMLIIKNPIIKDQFSFIMMLVSYFAAPILICIMLRYSNSNAKLRKTANQVYILLLLIFLLIVIITIQLNDSFLIPMLLMVLAYIVLITSISNNDKYIKEYIEGIIEYENSFENNDKTLKENQQTEKNKETVEDEVDSESSKESTDEQNNLDQEEKSDSPEGKLEKLFSRFKKWLLVQLLINSAVVVILKIGVFFKNIAKFLNRINDKLLIKRKTLKDILDQDTK